MKIKMFFEFNIFKKNFETIDNNKSSEKHNFFENVVL